MKYLGACVWKAFTAKIFENDTALEKLDGLEKSIMMLADIFFSYVVT